MSNQPQEPPESNEGGRWLNDQLIPLADLLAREKIRPETLIGVLNELRATDTEAEFALGLVRGSIKAARVQCGFCVSDENRRYGKPKKDNMGDEILKRCRVQKYLYMKWRS